MSPRVLPLLAAALLAVSSLFTGCATAPATYRTRADTAGRLPGPTRIAIAPPDVEVYEISAGGVTELRDEWTRTVEQHLRTELGHSTGFKPAPVLDPELQKEFGEVSSLLRAISLNQAMSVFGPRELQPNLRPLDYHVGSIARLADACDADALLFIFVRDSYATAGRKALAVLGALTGAVTGVVIVPQLGSTAGSAALVQRDGTVLWFNVHGAASGDLREPAGAAGTVHALLAGLPKA